MTRAESAAPRISLIVPCFNESGLISSFAEGLNKTLPPLEARFGVTFEIIFVDDGSSDGTGDVLRGMAMASPARLIVLSRNFGKEAALTAGLDAATGDAAILMDADFQHPPERIAELIGKWRDGYEVVYFFKQDRAGEAAGKDLASRLFYRLVNWGGRFDIPRNAGDFRLMDRRVVEALRQLTERQRFLKGLYGWVGFRQLGIPFEVPERPGESGSRFSTSRLVALALDGLTSFSIAPVRMISIFGFAVAGLSMLYLVWIVTERLLFGSPFSGFASIIVLITFFGGVQLICLGIIGEYVGKTLLEAKQRPTYIIRERCDICRAEGAPEAASPEQPAGTES